MSLGALTAHAAPAYTYVDLGTLGGASSIAYDINDLRQIVGTSDISMGSQFKHAALWSNGKATDLAALAGNAFSGASAINNAGQIVGYTSAGPNRATLWDNGKVVYLGADGQTSSANGINQNGQIVGTATDPVTGLSVATQWSASQPQSGSVLQTGAYGSEANGINNHGDAVGNRADEGGNRPFIANEATHIDLPTGGKPVYATAINDNGQAVGSYRYVYEDQYFSRPVLWTGGKMVNLSILGGRNSNAFDINSKGDIVGFSESPDSQRHAMLWTNGAAIDLDSFLSPEARADGWRIAYAHGINDLGDIVGDAVRGEYEQEHHAFVLLGTGSPVTPVPEPETYAMVLSSLAMFGVLRRRAKKRGTR